MGKTIGVVSRFPEHLSHFDLAYYEVKDVAGVWHPPIVGTVPMVSVFGDNRAASDHPEWVQVDANGQRAVRSSRYFDWDAICPSHPEVRRLAVDWVQKAAQQSRSRRLRLDDASFAREGYCRCELCLEKAGGQDQLEAYRQRVISAFVEEVRNDIPHVDMTLFPDPLPGHLERRFGNNLDQLSDLVDRFIVPIYDLHYATTYWLEILAQGFRERLTRPFFVELYALGVAEEALGRAAEVALHYADGVLFAYGNKLDALLRLRERLERVS
ncbi:hypothetical protein [Sulfobacillus harzensis]|uniref:DUF4015 domain-containing protein n=1 Tax=Sulfobacillus harzensis TaxID=2729629 RepID=A0A7Y0Q4P9_9FIRM|nr:hypothetical protein [Sulfobacillus harzensis]NMP23464.1 hypothetical protein [Sulfobacillus harzensis]